MKSVYFIISIFVLALAGAYFYLEKWGSTSSQVTHYGKTIRNLSNIPDIYYQAQTLPLDPATQGQKGFLSFFQGKKLYLALFIDKKLEKIQESKESDTKGDFEEPILAVIGDNQVLDWEYLHLANPTPSTSLKEMNLYGTGRKSYFVKQLNNVPWGDGFAGLEGWYGQFFEVFDAKLLVLTVCDDKTGESSEMDVSDTQMETYKILPSRKGNGKEIYIYSFEHQDNGPMSTYQLYSFNGQKWMCHTHQVPGGDTVSDSDDLFKDLSLFRK